jgi:hypothetical protein
MPLLRRLQKTTRSLTCRLGPLKARRSRDRQGAVGAVHRGES